MEICSGSCRSGLLHIDYAGASDPGRVRRCNEDAYLMLPDACLFAVADGLGGMGDGDQASRLAVTHLQGLAAGPPWWRRGSGLFSWWGVGWQQRYLGGLIGEVNRRLYEARIAQGSTMASTLALVRLWRNRALIAHVGDSRIHRWRQGQLLRLTTDHSLVAQLQRQGALTAQQAERSPQRHVLTRALGAERMVRPTLQSTLLVRGDLLLLCTDGLSHMVNEHEICRCLHLCGQDCAEQVRCLIELANQAGGHDNITVVVLAIR
jgi:protein phosphatase